MTTTPRRLSRGNPQIPKGYGEEPIRAYLDAAPGWQQAVCRRIDEVVSAEVPGVVKGVKWNTPLYGLEKDCWFLAYYCYRHYVAVTFFQGASLSPVPEQGSKVPAVRYHHVREGEDLPDHFADWVRQASQLPGEKM
jgi:hypothetical protein